MSPSSPLLDQYNRDGVVTPALQRALEMARQTLGQNAGLAGPATPPAGPVPRLTNSPSPAPALSPAGPSPAPISSLLGGEPRPESQQMAVPKPMTAAEQHQQRLTDVTTGEGAKSGIARIKNPWLRTPLQVLSAIGDAFVPGITQYVPGGELHHQGLVNMARANVNQDQAQATAEANRRQVGAETEELGASAMHKRAQAESLLHPPKPSLEWAQSSEPEIDPAHPEMGAQAVWYDKADPTKKHFGGAPVAAKPTSPKEPTNDFELWHKDNPKGTYEDFEKAKLGAAAKPLTPEHATLLNKTWDPIIGKYHLPSGQFKEGMASADAADMVKSFNDVIGKSQGAQHIVIQQGNAERAAKNDPKVEREYMAVRGDFNKSFEAAQHQIDAIQQAKAELTGGAAGQAVGTVKYLSSLASGAGSGVRITQAELNGVLHARGIQGDFEGWLSGLAGTGKLSTAQLQQMNAVLADVEKKAGEKQKMYSDALDKLGGAASTQEIRAIEKEFRKSMMASGTGGGQVPTVTTKEQFDALPSGSVYMEDGKKFKKP